MKNRSFKRILPLTTVTVWSCLLLLASAHLSAQTVFFSDSFNRANGNDLDAVTNGTDGLLITSGVLTPSNFWLEPIDAGRNVPGDSIITDNTLRMGGNGHSVNIVLDRNFATVMSTGMLSITLKLNGTPGPNDGSALNRYEGVGFGFTRAEGNVVSASVDRVLSRAADVFVAETANGRIRINDESPSSRSQSGDVAPTTTVLVAEGATAFVAGTLRLDFTITNGTAGSMNSYEVLFDAGNTGNFVTLATRPFVLSDNNQFYMGLENRATPSVFFDDLTISALGEYGPPANILNWRGQVNNNWDMVTTNWYSPGFDSYDAFVDGANVKFDDNASNTTVNVSATVTPGAWSVENVSSNYTFSGVGSIAGTVTLSKSGAGTVTMNLDNSYSGGSLLSSGKIRLGNDHALGSGLITLNGSALSSDGATARNLQNAAQINIATTLGDATDNGTITISGPVDFSGAGRAVTTASDVVFAGGAGNGRLGQKLGEGTLTVKGTVDYNGASDVVNGTLIYDSATVTDTDRLIADAGAGNGIARLVLTNGASITVNTSVGNLRSGRTASSGSNYVDVAGLYEMPNADAGNGTITLQANAAYSEMTFWPGGDVATRSVSANGAGSGTTVFKFNGGTLRARNDNANFFEGLSQTLVQPGGAIIDDGGFNITINQALLNDGGGLTKLGNGTLTLAGANTYSGTTTVSAGRLAFTSANASPTTISVADGAIMSFISSAPGAQVFVSAVNNEEGAALEAQFTGFTENPTAPAAYITNLVVNGALKVNVVFDNVQVGQFPLFAYENLTGASSFVADQLPSRVTATIVNNTEKKTIDLVVSSVAPPTFDDRYQVLRNSGNNPLDILRNDGGRTLISVAQPANGVAAISGTNIVYTPNSNYFGTDGFSYTSQDEHGVDTVSQVTLDVREYPNFVFILADDQGWTGLSVLMDTNRPNSKSDYYRTPRMEALAAQSMRFSYGYAPHPNCSPSRYSILTGKMPARTKLTDIIDRNDSPTFGKFKLITPGKAVNGLQSSDMTIAELLKTIPDAGYSAAHFGKWHVAGGGPGAHGFDADANDGATGNDQGSTGSAPINSDPKRTYSITDRALSYLDSRVTNGTPFYLQVSHYAVHEVTQTSQSSYDSYEGVTPGVWHNNRNYAGMTTDLDINVGRLLDELDALGIRNSTYVIYESDNGAPQSQSENYPLRGYKPEVWEGGERVPMFVRGPGIPANSQCNLPVIGVDFFPTIWQWATGSTTNLPPDIDGGSLVATIDSIAEGSNSPAPIVRGGEFAHHSPHYVGPLAWPNDWEVNAKDMRPRSTLHEGHYKLVANYEPGTIELYDLDNDIGEQTNLSPAQLAIKWQLWVRLRDYLKQVNAQMPTLDPTYPGTTNGTFVLTGATGPLGDADSDGLDDNWEFRELLTYTFDGNGDIDQDGVSNAQELAQGTDPLVPNAYRIDTITEVAPDQLRFTWNATPGASFAVESSTNLVDWIPATLTTTGDVFSNTVTVQKTMPEEFFRIRKL